MQKSKSNHSVFHKNPSSGIIMLVVYVDDIVLSLRVTLKVSHLSSVVVYVDDIPYKGLRNAKILLRH